MTYIHYLIGLYIIAAVITFFTVVRKDKGTLIVTWCTTLGLTILAYLTRNKK